MMPKTMPQCRLKAHVELKMRLYRKNQGILFEGADLDNRLKTFFDALQVPKDASQVPTDPSVSADPKGVASPILFARQR
jgi:Holliday junction resolvase RusA-like endonuclease